MSTSSMFSFALTALASVLFVVDPLGALPAYLTMTKTDDAAKRRRTAWRAALTATLVLAVFAACGRPLFRVLGLTLPALQIAGGLILFLVALDMMRAQRPTREGPAEVSAGMTKEDVAITPLAVPLLAGPAAMSAVGTLISQAHGWMEEMVVYLSIAVTGGVIYLTLRMSELLFRLLGRTGIQVLERVLGLVLAGIAVQFVLNGLRVGGIVFRGTL
jgi:multiple antibiotic resistance protein